MRKTGFGLIAVSLAAAAPDRTILPIAEPAREPSTTLDVRKATPSPRFEVKAPDGAPNVLLVLLDDRVFERVNAEIAGRPDPMAGRTSITLA